MSKKIIESFFNELINVRDNHKLSVTTIMEIIEKSTFSENVKKELKERINLHNHCEKEFLDGEDNENGETPFVVANYGEVNKSLECEGCYSVIIDDEVLDMIE